MASYVITDKAHKDLGASHTTWNDILAFIDRLISTREAHAAPQKRTRRKRGRFVVTKAKNIAGLAKTNLVISENDAVMLKGEDASSQILKKCRVVVVTSSPVGGIEGILRGKTLAIASLTRLPANLWSTK